MNIHELRGAINISECDLRMSLDEHHIDMEIKAITERSAQLEASHQQTFGGDDLYYKMNKSEVKQSSQNYGVLGNSLLKDGNGNENDKYDVDELDEVLSLQPEKLDLQSLNMSN